MSRVHLSVVLDCIDPDRLAAFWAATLGYAEVARDDVYIGLRPVARSAVRAQPTLVLQRVPEPKVGKNRMHLDVFTEDLPGDLHRLATLGAAILVPEHLESDGTRLAVLADPEGNEFCLLEGAPDAAQPGDDNEAAAGGS